MEQIQKSLPNLKKLEQTFLEKHTIGFEFLKLLHQKGVEARFVGGIVRRFFLAELHPELSIKSSDADYDVCVKAKPIQLKFILIELGISVLQENTSYGTFKVQYKNYDFDLACLRQDINSKGRHCNVIFIDSFEEDSLRRDFTFNAISIDYSGRIFDYHNGIDDLIKRKVTFIGEYKIRIQEDVLRLWRYVRFCAEFHITPKKEVLAEALNHIKLLNKLPLKHVLYEWKKIKKAKNDIDSYIKILKDYQMIQKYEDLF